MPYNFRTYLEEAHTQFESSRVDISSRIQRILMMNNAINKHISFAKDI